MNLDVTKTTFEKYLVNLGYNYKINQFEDFKLSIFRIIKRTIMNSIENNTISETIDAIFNKDISMKALERMSEMKNIKDSFITSLIEEGLLDLFLENRNIRVSREEKEKIYLATKAIEMIEKSTNKNVIRYLREEYVTSQKISMKKIKEIVNDKIDIKLENEEELDSKMKTNIILNMITEKLTKSTRQKIRDNEEVLPLIASKITELVILDEGIKYFNFTKVEEILNITRIKEYFDMEDYYIQFLANDIKNHRGNVPISLLKNPTKRRELMELIKNEKNTLKIVINYDGKEYQIN